MVMVMVMVMGMGDDYWLLANMVVVMVMGMGDDYWLSAYICALFRPVDSTVLSDESFSTGGGENRKNPKKPFARYFRNGQTKSRKGKERSTPDARSRGAI